jgi:hypothetical protein
MAAITINDLHTNRALDRKAMSSIRGAGAGWVYGWIRPYVPAVPSFGSVASSLGSVVNFYQINNIYHADQMNNQFQVIDINSSGSNATINVAPEQVAINLA